MYMNATLTQTQWSLGEKLSFRYIFVLLTLIIFPFPLNLIPYSDLIFDYYINFWTWMINLAGSTFFGVEEEMRLSFTGSGDKLYDWLWYFCAIFLTLLIGTIWSILDRKRANYARLKPWFVLIVTYYLAYFLLVYGIIKLFYLQFVPPNLERLYQTFGQASPMRLMWTFMGFSQTYTVFAGFSETLAGALLFFRKTRTLGALLAIGVMFNVFMMNMSYDIPVKLFSFQLMMIGVYIASLDTQRLINFFILNRDAPARRDVPLVTGKRATYILLAFQILFVGYIVYQRIDGGLEGQKQYGSKREKSALYGVYKVDTFIQNQDTLPPLLTDTLRWQRVIFDYPQFTSITDMGGKPVLYDSNIDTLKKTIEFAPRGDTVNKYTLNYVLDDQEFRLEGIFKGDTLQVISKKYDLKNFALLNRGFHWINEVPYNRYNYDD